ncbi:MAG: Hpt domain-containing protein [Clostridia bacterium]|nr:Hpt domain-containing protein [Clostridia bacterium]
MTLSELYCAIDGDYSQALRILRVDKLIDKHIRRLPTNTLFSSLSEAGRAMDASSIFENAHALKGVCSNLGLVKLAGLASQVCDEFRPGNPRTMTDEEVAARLKDIDALYRKACEGIGEYEKSNQ